jgi:hypothetical protein
MLTVDGGTYSTTALRANGSVYEWGFGLTGTAVVPQVIDGLLLADNLWLDEDWDGDGLTNASEYRLGTDPLSLDTNADGIDDGLDLGLGLEAASLDVDFDGLSNDQEYTLGTDPFRADTDGDGVPDGQDLFPLDPARSQPPAPNPNDHTPPAITLLEPAGAVPVP